MPRLQRGFNRVSHAFSVRIGGNRVLHRHYEQRRFRTGRYLSKSGGIHEHRHDHGPADRDLRHGTRQNSRPICEVSLPLEMWVALALPTDYSCICRQFGQFGSYPPSATRSRCRTSMKTALSVSSTRRHARTATYRKTGLGSNRQSEVTNDD